MKLTAVDGSRIRKLNIVEFRSKSDNSYYEHCICCLTNQVGHLEQTPNMIYFSVSNVPALMLYLLYTISSVKTMQSLHTFLTFHAICFPG